MDIIDFQNDELESKTQISYQTFVSLYLDRGEECKSSVKSFFQLSEKLRNI